MSLSALSKAMRPLCLECNHKEAKSLTLYKDSQVFCSQKCAATWGIRRALESQLRWCPRHGCWENEISQEQCALDEQVRLADPRIPLD